MFDRANPAGWTDDNTVITAAQINKIDVNQSRSVDGAGGSNGTPYTPSTVIDIAGQGIQLSGVGTLGKVQLSSRSITRIGNPIHANPDTPGNWVPSGSLWVNAVTSSLLYIPLDFVPHGATLNSLSVWIHPAASGSLPAGMPSITIVETILSTAVTSAIGGVSDTSANNAAFRVLHAITKGGLAWAVDRSVATIYVALQAEQAVGGAVVGCLYSGISATWTQTYMDDGAA